MTRTCETRVAFASRRGAAILAAVILLAFINLLVIASVRPAGDEALIVESRVLSLRALHAAESGVRVVTGSLIAGQDVPEEGTVVSLATAEFEIVAVPPPGEPGEIVVEGRAGNARRTLSIIVR